MKNNLRNYPFVEVNAKILLQFLFHLIEVAR